MTSPNFFKMTATAAPALPGKLSRLLASHAVTLPAGKMSVVELDKILARTKMSTCVNAGVNGCQGAGAKWSRLSPWKGGRAAPFPWRQLAV